MLHWKLFSESIPPAGRNKLYLIKAKDFRRGSVEVHFCWIPIPGSPIYDMEASSANMASGKLTPLDESLTPLEWLDAGQHVGELLIKYWLDHAREGFTCHCYRVEFAVFSSHLADPIMLTAFDAMDESEAPDAFPSWENKKVSPDSKWLKRSAAADAKAGAEEEDEYKGADSE